MIAVVVLIKAVDGWGAGPNGDAGIGGYSRSWQEPMTQASLVVQVVVHVPQFVGS